MPTKIYYYDHKIKVNYNATHLAKTKLEFLTMFLLKLIVPNCIIFVLCDVVFSPNQIYMISFPTHQVHKGKW